MESENPVMPPAPGVSVPQPQTVTPVLEPQTVASVVSPEPEKPKTGRRKVFLVFIGVLLLLFAVASGVYAVAYEKVVLPDRALQKKVSHFVMGLPLTPKTPEYVLERALMAHMNVTSYAFDLSVASQQSGLLSSLGLSKFDASAKGAIDYSDPKSPIFYADLAIAQFLEASFRKPDSKLYIKVDKLPDTLLAIFGVEADALYEALSNWIVYDTSSPDTAARRAVDEQPVKSALEILDKDDFRDNLAITTESINGEGIYKISFKGDKETLSSIYGDADGYEYLKENSGVEQITIETFIGRNDYLVRRISANTTIAGPGGLGTLMFGLGTGATNEKFEIAAVVDFSDYGEAVVVQAPQDSITVDDFLRMAFPASGGGLSGPLLIPSRQFAQARNTQRQSDLLQITNAIYQYAAEHDGHLPGDIAFPKTPTCIGTQPPCFNLGAAGELGSTIVPTYIAAVPTDPSSGDEANSGYLVHVNENGRVVAEAPGAELGEEIVVVR